MCVCDLQWNGRILMGMRVGVFNILFFFFKEQNIMKSSCSVVGLNCQFNAADMKSILNWTDCCFGAFPFGQAKNYCRLDHSPKWQWSMTDGRLLSKLSLPLSLSSSTLVYIKNWHSFHLLSIFCNNKSPKKKLPWRPMP